MTEPITYTEQEVRNRGLLVPPPAVRDWGWLVSEKETCNVSVSQSETFEDCWRKWGFGKIGNIRTSTPATDLGSAVHKQRELWLRDSVPFDLTTKEGEIAIQGIEHLPSPGTCLVEQKIEHWIRPRTFTIEGNKVRTHDGGLLLVAVIDLLYEDDEGVLNIDDHKTHGRYPPKTEDELRSNFQWNVYAWLGFHQLTDLDVLRTCWHYLKTQKPYGAKPVRIEAERNDPRIAAEWSRFVAVCELIERVRRSRCRGGHLPIVGSFDAIQSCMDLPPSPHNCGKYGGCRHHSTAGGSCLLTDEDEIESAGKGTIRWR